MVYSNHDNNAKIFKVRRHYLPNSIIKNYNDEKLVKKKLRRNNLIKDDEF